MAVVFLYSVDGEVIALDATTDVTYTRSASATKSTVIDGSSIADHYHANLPTIAFSGIVTGYKLREGTPFVSEFVQIINELMDSGTPFTLYGTEDNAIPTEDNMVITNFQVIRNQNTMDSLEVALSLEQMDISSTIKLTDVTLPAKNTDGQLANNVSTGGGTKTEVDDGTVDGFQLTQAAKAALNRNTGSN